MQRNNSAITCDDAVLFLGSGQRKKTMAVKRKRAKSLDETNRSKQLKLKRLEQVFEKLDGNWENCSVAPLQLIEHSYTGMRVFSTN